MGAWGIGVYENDGAGDFLAELRDAAAPREVLAYAVESGLNEDYLEVDEGTAALTAAAVIAAITTGVAPQDEPTAAATVAALSLSASDVAPLIPVALEALDRVAAKDSELAELWDEVDKGDEWRATVDAVRTQLTA